MIDIKTLRFITQNGLQSFAIGRILDGIAALHTLMPYCATETIICAEAESLEKNYHYMLSFLRQGGNDKKHSEVQAKIQRQGISLLEQASRAIRISLKGDLYSKALTQLQETYGKQIRSAVLEKWSSLLTPEEITETQDDLFDLIWTLPLWTAQDTAQWYDFILGQRDMVQQHLAGALFLSAWEYYDAEKMQLLSLLSESECYRTRITAVTYLLLLRLRHKELALLIPPLPDSILSKKGRKLIARVQYEMLLMLISEKDMEQELKEAEALSQELFSDKKSLNIKNIKAIIEMRGRHLRNRIQRGLDPNLSKAPLLHSCKYLHRIAHWFLPFDKNHPLFQSVMIDENGNEKQKLSVLIDLILDCDVDKLATLYLVSNDKDFSKAAQQLNEQDIPDIEHAVTPEYSFRCIMQDLYRFFLHSPLNSQVFNPFHQKQTLLGLPDLATLFSVDDCLSCCNLLYELAQLSPERSEERCNQVLTILNDVISREGASVPILLLKGKVLRQQNHYTDAINCVRSAEILEPDNTDILRFLVECYATLNRFEEQLEYLQRLAELHPEDKSCRLLIPITMNKIGRHEEALQLLFKIDYEASEDDDNYALLLSCIASTALELGKLDIAERYTEKSEELKVKDEKSFTNPKWENQLRMGHIKLLQGDWKGSLNYYEQFVNIFCKESGKDIKAALSELGKNQKMLTSKGIAPEDLLIIHDILQSASEGTL